MTTVLIIDPNESTRSALETQLAQSNQFGRVLVAASWSAARVCLLQHDVKVILIDAQQAQGSAHLKAIKNRHPELGVVLVQDQGEQLDQKTLQALGGHAQTTRLAAPIEIMVCVAKALVAPLKPGKRMLGKFLKD